MFHFLNFGTFLVTQLEIMALVNIADFFQCYSSSKVWKLFYIEIFLPDTNNKDYRN